MNPTYCRLILLALLVIIGGCTLIEKGGNIRPLDFDRDLAFPIAKTSISLKELLDGFDSSGLLEVGSDGLITYKYDSTITVYSGDDFKGIRDFQIQPGDTLTTLELGPLLSQSVTKASLKGGVLSYFVQVDSPGSYSLLLELPDLRQNGEPLRLERTDFYNDTLAGVIPLNGYELNAPQEEVQLKIVLRSAVNQQLILPKDARIGVQGIAFSYLQLKRINYDFLPTRDSFATSLLPFEATGSVFFADPSLDLTFINSFGIPLEINVNELSATNAQGDRVQLESALLDDPVSLDYPELSDVGSSRSRTFSFNQQNSNFVDFLNIIPNQLVYDYVANSFYEPISSADEDIFLLDTSRLDLNIAFTLPFDLRISEFSFTDTLDLSLDLPELDQYSEAEFKLITENGIPLTASMQVYVLQEGVGVLDSLFDGLKAVLGPASVDRNGNLTETAIEEFFFSLSKERIERIRGANQLLVKSVFSSTHQPGSTVKLYAESRLDLKLGVKTFADRN